MKKILSWIIIFILMATPSWATDYYACNSSTAVQSDNWCTAGATGLGSCAGTPDTTAETALQSGNTLYANGCTLAITDSFTATKISNEDGDGAGAAVAGGAFTLSTSTVSGKTLTTAIKAGSADCLLISGTGAANPVLTILGQLDGSSTTSNADAVYDQHTVGTVVLGASGSPITSNGGNGYNGAGYSFVSGTTGGVIAYVNAIGITGRGLKFYVASSSTASLVGTCTGSSTAVDAEGCYSWGAVGLSVTGNIINGTRSQGTSGSIIWNPTAPADGVTGHYVKFDGGGTAVFAGKNTDDATKALSTFYYIDPTDGTSDVGSETAGGGLSAYAY
jgi:hypothetical protein